MSNDLKQEISYADGLGLFVNEIVIRDKPLKPSFSAVFYVHNFHIPVYKGRKACFRQHRRLQSKAHSGLAGISNRFFNLSV